MNIVPYSCPLCGHPTGDFGVGVPELLTCIDCKRQMCHGCIAKRRLFTRPKTQCRECAAAEAAAKEEPRGEPPRQGTP